MKNIMIIIQSLYLPFAGINLRFINDIIKVMEQIMSFGRDEHFATKFIIEYTRECKIMIGVRIANLQDINFYKSEGIDIALGLINKGFNIFMTNYIMFTLGKNKFTIIDTIFNKNEEMGKAIAQNFNKIQLNILLNLIEEGININKAFAYIIEIDKHKSEKIYNLALTGFKYHKAMNHIMSL